MKKILKMLGLLFVSAVMFAGCQMNETPLTVSEVNLTEKRWEMYKKTSFNWYNHTLYYAVDLHLLIEDGIASVTSAFEEEDTGGGLTMRILEQNEVQKKYNNKYQANHFENYFEGAKIKTNRNRSQYVLTYDAKQEYLGKEYDAVVTITLKKIE
jgi:hypothetical protein